MHLTGRRNDSPVEGLLLTMNELKLWHSIARSAMPKGTIMELLMNLDYTDRWGEDLV